MIVTTPDEWVALYNAIKEESSCSEEKHVFIYASAADADSVAALRILEVSRGEMGMVFCVRGWEVMCCRSTNLASHCGAKLFGVWGLKALVDVLRHDTHTRPPL